MKLSEFTEKLNQAIQPRAQVAETGRRIDRAAGAEPDESVRAFDWAWSELKKILVKNRDVLTVYKNGETNRETEVDNSEVKALISAVRRDALNTLEGKQRSLDEKETMHEFISRILESFSLTEKDLPLPPETTGTSKDSEMKSESLDLKEGPQDSQLIQEERVEKAKGARGSWKPGDPIKSHEHYLASLEHLRKKGMVR